MHLRFAPLLLLGLSACWPRIPGSWEDYADPALTGITGEVQWIEPQGAYWEDNSPYGWAWWAVIDPPSDFSAAELYTTVGEGCTTNDGVTDALEHFLAGGSGTSRLHNDSAEIRAAWQEDGAWFVTALDDGDFDNGTTYDLASIDMSGFGGEWEAVGDLDLPSFVETPSAFSLDTPEIDGDSPGFLSSSDLTFEWRGGEPSDTILLELTLITSGQTFLERAFCLVPNDSPYTVPTDTFTRLGEAATMLIAAGPVLETTGAIPEHSEAGFRMAGVHRVQGAATVE